jgi:hypothetical protein
MFQIVKKKFNKNIIKTNCFEKIHLTISSTIKGLINPDDSDSVATLGEITGSISLKSMLKEMKSTSV